MHNYADGTREHLVAEVALQPPLFPLFRLSYSAVLLDFTAPILTWSLSAGLMHPCFLPQISTMCLLFCQNNNKLYSFLHALIAL